jgi:hypothetical protein
LRAFAEWLDLSVGQAAEVTAGGEEWDDGSSRISGDLRHLQHRRLGS